MTAPEIATEVVLVVEDETLVRMFAVDVLTDAGFKVEEACSAEEALAKAGALRSKLRAALIDVGLPDRSGEDLAREVREIDASLPIVIASGRSEQELTQRFEANGQCAILAKPYTEQMLLDALASVGVSVR
ncbi:MAG TPA: response regulator [Steroidobacter sp.]